MISASTGKTISDSRTKFIMAAYSDKGIVIDPDGNHVSFNIYKRKNPQIDIKKTHMSDLLFVRSCYKFRTAKRILQRL